MCYKNMYLQIYEMIWSSLLLVLHAAQVFFVRSKGNKIGTVKQTTDSFHFVTLLWHFFAIIMRISKPLVSCLV